MFWLLIVLPALAFPNFRIADSFLFTLNIFSTAMPAKKEILLDSIKKLLSMNVSEEEIVENLAVVGVSKPEALTLIKEAKTPAPEQQHKQPLFGFLKREKKKQPEKAVEGKAMPAAGQPSAIAAEREKATEQLADQIIERVKEEKKETGEIIRGLGYEEEEKEVPAEKDWGKKEKMQADWEKEETPAGKGKWKEEAPADEWKAETPAGEDGWEEAEEAPAVKEKKEVPQKKPVVKEEKRRALIFAKPKATSQAPIFAKPKAAGQDQDLSKLWEKGILVTVNSKLQEMRQLRKDLDSILDAKIAAATKRELDKIKVLFDSQRALLVSKVDTELQQKANAFAQMIELKLRDMRSTAKEIESDIEKIRSEKQQRKEQESALTERLRDLEQTKQRITAEMGAELIKAKSELQRVLDEANKRLRTMDDRVNKTLQLQSEITEGLAKDAAAKIEERLQGSAAGLGREAAGQLDELRTSRAALETQIREKLALVDRKMAELDSFEKNFAKEMGIALDEIRKKKK